ncbi:hypothetical protein EV385_4074 [Krasilnikovia cinnamomea]|uniref:Uncharacterized protein n=1 Tax=Krasilnikovia cinnamomea TaxID=349313 RepID=A0A4Q7ZMK1_9ACTN|nr:hypothetical protein EV385_4074 [Krasilnikovia cinnamomea]
MKSNKEPGVNEVEARPRFYGSHEVGMRIWAVEGFPEPAAELHQGPIWDGDEVDAWAEAVRSTGRG